MKKYTQDELQEMAKPYFDKGKDKMLASEDGQFFYPESDNAAWFYGKTKKVQIHEVEPKKEVKTEPKKVIKKEDKEI